MDGRTRGYDVVFYHDVPHVLDSMMTISHKEQDTHVASDACRARARIERAGRVEEEREGASRKGEVLPHRIARRSSFVGRRSFVPPRTRAGRLAGRLARRRRAFPRTSPPLDSFPAPPRARSSSRASPRRPRARSPRARPSSETTSRTRAGSNPSSSNPSSSNPSSSFADRLSRVANSPTRATNRIESNRTDAGRTPPHSYTVHDSSRVITPRCVP